MIPRGREPAEFYGIRSWLTWEKDRPKDLSRTKTTGAQAVSEPAFKATTYSQLMRVVSFLNVMNKNEQLLFRGQSGDWPLVPSLFRETWGPPRESGIEPVHLPPHRQHYLAELNEVRRRVAELLGGERRLPRWRPFQTRPEPAWAVIQHYEIWPTPMLDLTSSLRVAASFALGLHERNPGESRDDSGYVYVVAVPIQSDPMILKTDKVQALRLNSVCPPSAARPHFQEGFLMLWPDPAGDESPDAHSRLVARFLLEDHHGRFWTPDFPRHTRASLLPEVADDELLREFRELFIYRLEGGRVSLGVNG